MSQESWKSALLDESGTYRYLLSRRWDTGRPTVAFCMLNPSTADGTRDDATIRRCLAFATRWGYGELLVTNCFALRSPHPALLRKHPHPIGPDNHTYLLQAAERASCIVVAWGTQGRLFDRDLEVLTLLTSYSLQCLGLTRRGDPRHPLYVPASQILLPFPGLPERKGKGGVQL